MNAAQPIRISLTAPNGRMGKAIAAAAAESGVAIDPDGGDVLVDFSALAVLKDSIERAVSAGIPILVGTTGLDQNADRQIAEAAKQVAVLKAPNTSLGVALLAELVERAARVLGPDWDIEIAETHHRMKADAPSGTALFLGEAAARGRGTPLHAERGRDSTGLKRQQGSIGFASLRGGTVAGRKGDCGCGNPGQEHGDPRYIIENSGHRSSTYNTAVLMFSSSRNVIKSTKYVPQLRHSKESWHAV